MLDKRILSQSPSPVQPALVRGNPGTASLTSFLRSPNSKRVRFQLRMHPKQRGFDSTQITSFDYDLAVESRFST